MSALLMGHAFYVPVDSTSRLILVALADHAHDDGSEVRPGVARLAKKGSCSERTVQYAIRYFEAHDLMWATACRYGGRGRAAVFQLNVDAFESWYQLHKTLPDAWVAEQERVQRLHRSAVKGATCDMKGCNLKQKRVQWAAPQPSENHQEPEVSISKENPRRDGEPIGDYMVRIAALQRSST